MNTFQRWIAPFAASLLLSLGLWAQAAPYSATPIQAIPPSLSTRDFPAMMMLTASRDHTLFGPMFTDYEDLTGSGKVDPTFRADFQYYGYFDSTKCYGHDGSMFVPKAFAQDGTVCSTIADGRWSGNFLNWATSTRIDVVRKMLYGGYRDEDTDSGTVLQLTQLGTDAHAFAKYYYGRDIALFTPFSTDDLTKGGAYVGLTTCTMSTTRDASSGSPILRLAKGNYTLWSTMAKRVCQWRPEADLSSAANADYFFGDKLSRYFQRDVSDTAADLQGMVSHESVAPYPDSAHDLPPNVGRDGLTIRVLACANKALVGKENCKAFTRVDATSGAKTIVLKPAGILQDYGYSASSTDAARAEFGLVSGSYDNGLSGGVLRKNIGNLNDEVNADGSFCYKTSSACGGIIKSFDSFRLFGAGASSYTNGTRFTWVAPKDLVNRQFPSWGNPMGEMLIEALSYFANKGPSSYRNSQDAAIDGRILGLPAPAWQDPLDDTLTVPGSGGKKRGQVYGKSLCRPMSMLAISSSALSFDRDDIDQFEQLPNREGQSLAGFTDVVGRNEGINGSMRSVADIAGGFGDQCEGKTVALLSDISGICPEAPATRGSYLSAGAALYGNTRAVRQAQGTNKNIPGFEHKDLPADLPPSALHVKTLAAAMGGGVARIEVVNPSTGAKVYITPESMWSVNGTFIPGAMLTIKLINSTTNSAGKTIGASYVVTWNDAQFGGDYDMDIVGYIAYKINGQQLLVTTDILNVDGGLPGSHGFSIMGAIEASSAKRYITHGSNAIAFGECNQATLSTQEFNLRCRFNDGGMPTVSSGTGLDQWAWPSTYEGQVVGFAGLATAVTRAFGFASDVPGSVLEDPLWYAAKYGSFNAAGSAFSSASTASLPAKTSTPEGYFLARDPVKLEAGLRRELDKILAASNATPAVSTAQLISSSLKYVAEFDAKAHTGNVKAYALKDDTFESTPKFDLATTLRAASDAGRRQVITDVDGVGKALQVAVLESTSVPALADVRSALDADAGVNSWKDLVLYARGGAASGDLRLRTSNVLGPIVNAAPWLQRGALLRATDADLPDTWASYRQFATDRLNADQPPVLWVASNDSMLHAFNANDGTPLMSYLPSPLMAGLRAASRESNTALTATMDGSPVTADVYIPASTGNGGAWQTYLFSSLGRGGRAVFALDVTNPTASNLTESRAGSIFKWQFSSDDDADLGYVTTDPVIHRASGQPSDVVRLNNGRFALMVPNGYGSDNGRAVLFLLDVAGRYATGTQAGTWGDRKKPLVAAEADSGNGLMGATWVDIDNNGTADWVYATDLKGQLWKFDISSTDPSQWGSAFKVGNAAVPLFQARSGETGTGAVLPITSAPTVTYPGMGGVMVTFGTGKAIVTGDFPKTNLDQRLYTIWDRGNFTASTSPDAQHRALPGFAQLLGRQLVRDDATGEVSLSDADAAAAIDWANQDGWYLNFALASGQSEGTGEMVLSTPVVRSGALFFTTVRPKDDPESLCQNAPAASLYVMSPTQGLALGNVLTTSDSGSVVGVTIDDPKVLVTSDQTVETGADKVAIRVMGGGSGANSEKRLTLDDPKARIQWRVIPGMKTQ